MRKTVEKAAEYVNRDPRIALQQLRLVAEEITFGTAANCRLPLQERQDFLHKLKELQACGHVPSNIDRSLHTVRRAGNKAAHPGKTVTASEAADALGHTLAALEWYEDKFCFRADKTFKQFREDIKSRMITTPIATEPPKAVKRGGPTFVDTADSADFNSGNWISGVRRKTELVLDIAENGVRSVSSWAAPRAGAITSSVRGKTSGALRSLSKALGNWATKHGA